MYDKQQRTPLWIKIMQGIGAGLFAIGCVLLFIFDVDISIAKVIMLIGVGLFFLPIALAVLESLLDLLDKGA